VLSPRAGFRVAAILLLSVCVRQPSQLVAQEASAPDAPQTVRVPRELSVPGSSAPASPADRTASDTLAADLLAQARELRRQGNPRDAYALYRRWLEQNSGSPDYGAVLAEAASCAPDVVLSVELYRRYGSGVADGRLREQLLVE
jgi:hypothetical protein